MPVTREKFHELKFGKDVVAVETFLKSSPDQAFTRQEISDAINLHRESVFDALRSLVEGGKVDTTGNVDEMRFYGPAGEHDSQYYIWASAPHVLTEVDDPDPSNAGRTPNDQRSDSLNPNNPAFRAGQDNRAKQLNPDHPAYRATRSGK